MARFQTGLFAIALLAMVALAPRTAHALEGAAPDAHDSFAVAIVTQGAPGQTRPQCSGVLISENVVLTARHCFDAPPAPTATLTAPTTSMNCELTPSQFAADAETLANVASQVWITTSHNAHVAASAGWHRASRIHVPSSSRDVCGADIALVVLEDRVHASEAIAASPAPSPSAGSSTEKAVFAIGHGATTALGDDAGERRVLASMQIPSSSPPPSFGYFNPSSELLAGDGACLGDSGSGLFLSPASSPSPSPSPSPSARVVGVLARTRLDGEDGHCRDSVYERIDPWMLLLRDVVVAAAHESGSSVPEWTSTAQAMNVGHDAEDPPSGGGATTNQPRASSHEDRPSFSGEYAGCSVSRSSSLSSPSMITAAVVFALSLLVRARRPRDYSTTTQLGTRDL